MAVFVVRTPEKSCSEYFRASGLPNRTHATNIPWCLSWHMVFVLRKPFAEQFFFKSWMPDQGEVVPDNYVLLSRRVRVTSMILLCDQAGCFSWFLIYTQHLASWRNLLLGGKWQGQATILFGSEMKHQGTELWKLKLRSDTFGGDWGGHKCLAQLCNDVWSKTSYLVTRFLIHCKCACTVCL